MAAQRHQRRQAHLDATGAFVISSNADALPILDAGGRRAVAEHLAEILVREYGLNPASRLVPLEEHTAEGEAA